ncbi:MAG: TonB-dependent receptor, partial [Spirochaetia bacterium]|nr:TonB-dependent receptor [Spirochaetia bacterium]
MIKSVDIYTGAFPVRFGNATGGVISIEGPTKAERFGGHVNVALFLSDVYFESPLVDTGGFMAASARQSYPNVALLKLYPDAIPKDAKYAQYGDGQAKLMYKWGNHELTGLAFGAHDVLKYTKAVSDAANPNSSAAGGLGDTVGNLSSGGTDLGTNGDTRPPVGLDRSFFTEGIKYSYSYKGLLRNTLLAEVSGFKESFQLDFRSPFTGETIFGFDVEDSRRETRFRDDLQIELIENHLAVNAGVESTLYVWEMSLRNFSPRRSINPNTPSFIDTVNNLVDNNRTFRALYDGDHTAFALGAAWTELEIDIWRLRLTPGVRAEYFDLSKDTGIGPRMNAELKIDETNTTLLAGAGRHYNIPTTLEQVSVEAGNSHLKMEESDHLA